MLRKRQRGGHFFAMTAGMEEAHLGLFMRFAAYLTSMGGAVPDIDAENAEILGRHWHAWRPAKEAALSLGLLARVNGGDGTQFLTLGAAVAAAFSWKINDRGAAIEAKNTRQGKSAAAVEIVEKSSAKRARAASEKMSPQEASSLSIQSTESLSSSSSSLEKQETGIRGREDGLAKGADCSASPHDLAAWIRQRTGMEAALEPGDEHHAKEMIDQYGEACARAAIEAYMLRKNRAIPGRVKYFTDVIRDFAKAVSKPPPLRQLPMMMALPGGAAAKTSADPNLHWRIALKCFAGDGKWSRNTNGPAPGEPGCRVPADVLAEFGLGEELSKYGNGRR